MKARSRGSSTASTMRTCPRREQACATFSTPCGVVRSPIPTSTDAVAERRARRRPRRWPLRAARRRRRRTRKSALREHRVEAVDPREFRRLAAPGRLRHRVDRDAAVDPARRCRAGTGGSAAAAAGSRRRAGSPTAGWSGRPGDVGLEHAADQQLGQRRRRRARREAARSGSASAGRSGSAVAQPVQRRRPAPRHVERLGEQVREVDARRRPGSAAARRTRRAPGAPAPPTARRRTAARRRSGGQAGRARGPGRCTITCRSGPTSEWTPSGAVPLIRRAWHPRAATSPPGPAHPRDESGGGGASTVATRSSPIEPDPTTRSRRADHRHRVHEPGRRRPGARRPRGGHRRGLRARRLVACRTSTPRSWAPRSARRWPPPTRCCSAAARGRGWRRRGPPGRAIRTPTR